MVTDTVSEHVELMTDLVDSCIKRAIEIKALDFCLEGVILAIQDQRCCKTVLFATEYNGSGGNLQRSSGNKRLKLIGNITVDSLSDAELSADD